MDIIPWILGKGMSVDDIRDESKTFNFFSEKKVTSVDICDSLLPAVEAVQLATWRRRSSSRSDSQSMGTS